MEGLPTTFSVARLSLIGDSATFKDDELALKKALGHFNTTAKSFFVKYPHRYRQVVIDYLYRGISDMKDYDNDVKQIMSNEIPF